MSLQASCPCGVAQWLMLSFSWDLCSTAALDPALGVAATVIVTCPMGTAELAVTQAPGDLPTLTGVVLWFSMVSSSPVLLLPGCS